MSIWMPWLRFDLMSAAAARGGATKSLNMRRVHMGKLADHAAQHNRVKGVLLRVQSRANRFTGQLP
jgi:hypothetical protein